MRSFGVFPPQEADKRSRFSDYVRPHAQFLLPPSPRPALISRHDRQRLFILISPYVRRILTLTPLQRRQSCFFFFWRLRQVLLAR